jgi:hypothetical protein
MDRGTCNAVWALLGSAHSRSLQDMELLGEIMPRDALNYLEELVRRDYVRFAGCKRLPDGEYSVTFRQIKRTGDYAPYFCDDGAFIDPNLAHTEQPSEELAAAAETARRTRNGLRKASLVAQVRVAAERLQSFTKIQLLEAVFGLKSSRTEEHWFRYAWNHLRLGGHIGTAEDDWFFLATDVDPIMQSIRTVLRKGIGRMISRHNMVEQLGFSPTGAQMRQALDLLTAEGLQVTKRGYGRRTMFLIEVANSADNGLPND